MALTDVTRESVLAAIAKYDQRGPGFFRVEHGFRSSRKFVLIHEGRQYDSKAILGVAHGYATGEKLAPADFNGRPQTIARLSALGFDVRDRTGLVEIDPPGNIGEVPGVSIGDTFVDRAEASTKKVHRALQAGIVGTSERGAESIVVSGGYEDDEDHGSMVIYTGHGGQHKDTKKQIADQTFDASGNAALLTSMLTGAPVRVIRGVHRGSPDAPDTGLRYDGLFRVEDAWRERGISGFLMCRYRLVSLDTPVVDVAAGSILADGVLDPSGGAWLDGVPPNGNAAPARKMTSAARLMRLVEVANYVKRLHDHTCQACGSRLTIGADRAYSEAAHIRGLGRPHDGPDVPENVLCLCPNHHVLFDKGALLIASDLSLSLNGQPFGQLSEHPSHLVDADCLAYHRELHV